MNWFAVKDGDPMAVGLFRRHYSCLGKPSAVYRRYGISGQGESMVLVKQGGDALFVWTKQRDRADGQTGVNCTVFRNESSVLSSSLIREAEELALARWPGVRLFTFVDPTRIRSTNPGACFRKAGWKRCGVTKKSKLIILEKTTQAK